MLGMLLLLLLTFVGVFFGLVCFGAYLFWRNPESYIEELEQLND